MKSSLYFLGYEVKDSNDRLKSKSLEHINLHDSDNTSGSLPCPADLMDFWAKGYH
jgi:hypothetical protein